MNSKSSKKIKYFNETMLHIACQSGNVDLVKYIVTSKLCDLISKDVLFYYFFNEVFKSFF